MARQFKKQPKVQKVMKVVKKSTPASSSSAAQSTPAASTTFVMPKGTYFEAVGRRKVATARVRIYEQSGDYIVNQQAAGQYFAQVPSAPVLYQKPLVVAGLQGKLTVIAKVSGSGIRSQLGAVVHGLSRAIVAYNPDLKPLLKTEGLLVRDDRMKETRKIGMGGKARRQRQSPKR